ncbi:hypothetical protein V496_02859 [Pseudogymnoascus sp. VKM F-4515 (FW-2607)]|nr:hypothetical protein V496_02859 [Pseudogymnoascus sp. VKM F-4515 (FW-2607)]
MREGGHGPWDRVYADPPIEYKYSVCQEIDRLQWPRAEDCHTILAVRPGIPQTLPILGSPTVESGGLSTGGHDGA